MLPMLSPFVLQREKPLLMITNGFVMNNEQYESFGSLCQLDD